MARDAATQEQDRAEAGARLQRGGLRRQLCVQEASETHADAPGGEAAVHDGRVIDDVLERDHAVARYYPAPFRSAERMGIAAALPASTAVGFAPAVR
jgi:hypothetical protein